MAISAEINPGRLRISLGPLQYFWPRDTVMAYYTTMAELPIDIFYLGETVCSKRREMKWQDWLTLAEQLSAQGKQVILSTLTLLEAESELSQLRRICDNDRFMVEANDMAAVQMLSVKGIPFVTGPFINIYNAHSLKLLHQQGLQRWVMPVELSAHALATILADAEKLGFAEEIETEVFSYGHLPLAFSARCFTARAHGLPKDTCMFVCEEYPSGLPVYSQEQQEAFNLNGIQTQSAAIYDLAGEVAHMQQMGVNILRLSPSLRDMSEVVTRFDQARQGRGSESQLAAGHCNGYWYHKPGMEIFTPHGLSQPD